MENAFKYEGEPQEMIDSETLRIILKKVKPIDSVNTAFHSISSYLPEEEEKLKDVLVQKLKKILKEGLLGFNRANQLKNYEEKDMWTTDSWKEEMKNKLDNPVYFKLNENWRLKHIKESYKKSKGQEPPPEIYLSGMADGGIQILFDVSSFSFEGENYSYPEETSKRDFPVHSYIEGNGEHKLYSRVAPRFFTGIRLTLGGEDCADGAIAAVLEVFKNKPELMLPIYNYHGDLIWPQKMSYEEIVKMKEISEQK